MGRRKRYVPDFTDGEWTFSKRLRGVLKKHPVPGYRIAIVCGIKPPSWYKFSTGMSPIGKSDPRIAKLAEIVGMSLDTMLVPFDRWGD